MRAKREFKIERTKKQKLYLPRPNTDRNYTNHGQAMTETIPTTPSNDRNYTDNGQEMAETILSRPINHRTWQRSLENHEDDFSDLTATSA